MTIDVDRPVAVRCAQLHVPDPRPERDSFIAATALVHGMTLVTRNVADFLPMGVSVMNLWREDHERVDQSKPVTVAEGS